MSKYRVIDLSTCSPGDILISSHGEILEYVCPTPYKSWTYLDHVVRYVEDGENVYGTRTNDGFVFLNKRIPETDHDIVRIIRREHLLMILEKNGKVVG